MSSSEYESLSDPEVASLEQAMASFRAPLRWPSPSMATSPSWPYLEGVPAQRRAGGAAAAGGGSFGLRHRPRRNSQDRFSEREQTCILLDWDDTLFPSTYSKSQARLPDPALVADCQTAAVKLLRLADRLGKVVIVTLADREWLNRCFASKYAEVGELVKKLGIVINCARSNDTEGMTFAAMKQHAIATELKAFYCRRGRSWKNVISIGDSQFERQGTVRATAEYMAERRGEAASIGEAQQSPHPWWAGVTHPDTPSATRCPAPRILEVDVNGHFIKVRTKTLKLVEHPRAQDLALELGMLVQWLPLMVAADSSLDLEVTDVGNYAELQAVGETLRGVRRAPTAATSVGTATRGKPPPLAVAAATNIHGKQWTTGGGGVGCRSALPSSLAL